MALIKFGVIVTEARKSIGGVTFSRNRAGAYTRKRTKGVNPNTAKQALVRENMRAMQTYWRNTLTPATRQPWTDLATASPMKNRLGEESPITGVNMFIRLNGARLYGGQTMLATAPAAPATCDMPPLVLTANVTVGISLAALSPIIASGEFLYLYVSGAKSDSRNFFKGPYTHDFCLTHTTTFPEVLIAPSLVAVNQRWFYRYRYQDVAGRLSTFQYGYVTIAAGA
jgi:hypothetical protein